MGAMAFPYHVAGTSVKAIQSRKIPANKRPDIAVYITSKESIWQKSFFNINNIT
jgi:hypothetical protein